MQKRILLTMISSLIFLLSAMTAQAGVADVDNTSASSNCDTVTVTWSHGTGDESVVTIFYGAEMESQVFFSNSGTFTFNFDPDLVNGTLIEVEIEVFDDGFTKSGFTPSFIKPLPTVEGTPPIRFSVAYSFFAINCSVETVEEVEDEGFVNLCPDGRLTYTLCDPLVVYNVVSDDGVGLIIYTSSRDNAGLGEFQLEIPAETFDALPANPEQNCTIASSDDGSVVVYLLSSGEIQIDAGPDDEGKIFSYIFADLVNPPTSIHTYISGNTPEILPSC